MRNPAFAGMFYPAHKDELKELINNCFENGAGKPKKRGNKTIKAVVAPHAGYIYSGICASYAYKQISESKKPDVFIILGTGHSGCNTCLSDEDFETPLGVVKNDKEFTEALAKEGIKVNNNAHSEEHSLEVQIPFLQTAVENPMIVPIIVGQDYEVLAEKIVDVADKLNKTFTIIVSSDFTHYGTNYNFVPFEDNIKQNMYNLDKEAISFILKLDDEGFMVYLQKSGATICGFMPIIVMIKICRLLKTDYATLLKYNTSGDIAGDYSNAVGYASILVE